VTKSQRPDTRGFDVTGVVTEVDLTFPLVQNVCDCIQQCLNRPTTCATYVYKFSTPASVLAGHRTCTLYSQFNLPADVVLDFNLNSTLNVNVNAAEIMLLGNNPQAGAPVPQAFMDVNLNTTADNDAFSGYVVLAIPSTEASADHSFQTGVATCYWRDSVLVYFGVLGASNWVPKRALCFVLIERSTSEVTRECSSNKVYRLRVSTLI
jgi:hypothetical protein